MVASRNASAMLSLAPHPVGASNARPFVMVSSAVPGRATAITVSVTA